MLGKPQDGLTNWKVRLSAVESAAVGANRQKRRCRVARDYEMFCVGSQLVAWPVSYESVAGFLVSFVDKQSGCTASLANTKSGLKKYCEQSGLPWLDLQATTKLADVESNLRFYDNTSVKRARPLIRTYLYALASVLCLHDSLDLMLLTLLFFGHDGLLRGGELWSDIRSKHMLWHSNGRGFTLKLPHTKTQRGRGGVTITITGDPDKINAVSLLRLWFKRRNLSGQPEALVFTGIVNDPRAKGGFSHGPWNPSTNKSQWIKLMRSKLDLIGLPSSAFSGHSLRAGGATDLFCLQLSLVNIMKYGRWKTQEECLVYFRDDLIISEEVNRLFQLCPKHFVFGKDDSGGLF